MSIQKDPKLVIKILALLLIAALSVFIVKDAIAEAPFVQSSIESVEENRSTIMKFSGATLSASLAISALPDDFATPLAKLLSDMNTYFVFLLTILLLEGILLKSGLDAAFGVMIPIACILTAISLGVKKEVLKNLAAKLLVLALAVAFVVPCSTYMTKIVAAELETYVEDTIVETEEGLGQLDDVMKGDGDSKTVFEKISGLFHSAIQGMSDLFTHIQNTIRKCMNAIAILIVTNFVMPLLTFFILKWILKETFNLVIPAFPVQKIQNLKKSFSADTERKAGPGAEPENSDPAACIEQKRNLPEHIKLGKR